MSVRSPKSSLTIVLTVENKIGLKQLENPNKYHARNLVKCQCVELFILNKGITKRENREDTLAP